MYIDTIENSQLCELREAWRRGEAFDIYLIYGPTGCGKTTFLNSIFPGDTGVVRYSGKDICALLIAAARNKTQVVLPECAAVFIEHIDDILYAEHTMAEVFRLMKKWAHEGKLIVCTATSNARLTDCRWMTQIAVKPLKVTQELICALAGEKGLSLSSAQIQELQTCQTVVALKKRLNHLELTNSMGDDWLAC